MTIRQTGRTPGETRELEVRPRGGVPSARRGPQQRMADWVEERVGLAAFNRKYGRKAFPVHTTFFLGEMALFSFVILVLTGAYLGLIYVPSSDPITIGGEDLPAAYASVRLIESIPVANLLRNVHHWASHLMIISIVLHSLRIYFTGTYRKPRELNWAIGVVLLGLSLMAGFVGYSLPYDSYAVTATGIGYGIARSIPFVGHIAADLFFGGAFPSFGSVPRLYTIHVFIVPAIMTAVMGLHLVLVIKQKHTQPGYARRLAEPGKVLGVPLWPYQAILAGVLLMLMFGVLFLLGALVPPHPLEAYGPPGPANTAVKPDWYVLWIYGFLKLIPASVNFSVAGSTFGPNFFGGLVFPAIVLGLLTLAPWLDSTNRKATRNYEYLEPPRQSPMRMAIGTGVLVYILMLFVAAYYDEIGLNVGLTWLLTIAVPLVTGAAVFLWGKRVARYREEDFDPRTVDTPATGDQPATEATPAD